MDTLPHELVEQILGQVDHHSLLKCRLTCKTFDHIIFLSLFKHILLWLDYKLSHRAVLSLAHNVCDRPAAMWSPWASCPDRPVNDSWMRIIWKLLAHSDGSPSERRPGTKGCTEVLSPQNFARLSGNENLTENRLRTGQNRFLMHRAYSKEVCGGLYWGGGNFQLGDLRPVESLDW